MAWFYNLIFRQFLQIGLVASSPRHYSPAATMVHKFAFFLRNSQIQKFRIRTNHEKHDFSMACFIRPILAIFLRNGRQFGLF
jgi:hypothetical protein